VKRITIVAVLLLLTALVWFIQRSSTTPAQIARHQLGWWQAVRAETSGAPPPPIRRLNPFRDVSHVYWPNRRQLHEAELLRLGYLTNCELRLSNQAITPAFYSNFFWRIRAELGTNTDQVWVGTALPNHAGLKPLLPAKDAATWERIFRECAVLYASNISTSVAPAP
jgi:hypothetical protein